jgi:hypothetical protein
VLLCTGFRFRLECGLEYDHEEVEFLHRYNPMIDRHALDGQKNVDRALRVSRSCSKESKN